MGQDARTVLIVDADEKGIAKTKKLFSRSKTVRVADLDEAESIIGDSDREPELLLIADRPDADGKFGLYENLKSGELKAETAEETEADDQKTSAVVADMDVMTGLPTKTIFLEEADEYLEKKKDAAFCMVAIDINHFRLFNQIYGRDAGDKYIIYMAQLLKGYVTEYGGVAGYGGGDDFYYLAPDTQELFTRMIDDVGERMREQSLEIGYAPKFGVFRIVEEDLTIMDICDSAIAALEYAKSEYSRLMTWYDSSMMNDSDDEFKLLQDVEFGLKNHEFTFYLQPKVNLSTGKVVGAEALARWIRQDNKMIAPPIYIPVLERNGFIFRLDKLIWEQVCRFQRFCMDMDYPVLPISVNVSRADVFAMDVSAYLTDLLKKYDLPVSCLELEITESAYIEETGELDAEIEKFKACGFTVSMDDFGSGYSSLNSLKDLDVDVLKIDMRFLDVDYRSAYKGISILDFIMQMADQLNLAVIVEGVEFPDQVDFLTALGCDYVQGFYYYKPMRKEAYEDLISDTDNIDIKKAV